MKIFRMISLLKDDSPVGRLEKSTFSTIGSSRMHAVMDLNNHLILKSSLNRLPCLDGI